MGYTKKFIDQITQTAKIIDAMENNGFQETSMEQYQAIVADLIPILSGTTGKKRGRKPGVPAAVNAVEKRKPRRPRKKGEADQQNRLVMLADWLNVNQADQRKLKEVGQRRLEVECLKEP